MADVHEEMSPAKAKDVLTDDYKYPTINDIRDQIGPALEILDIQLDIDVLNGLDEDPDFDGEANEDLKNEMQRLIHMIRSVLVKIPTVDVSLNDRSRLILQKQRKLIGESLHNKFCAAARELVAVCSNFAIYIASSRADYLFSADQLNQRATELRDFYQDLLEICKGIYEEISKKQDRFDWLDELEEYEDDRTDLSDQKKFDESDLDIFSRIIMQKRRQRDIEDSLEERGISEETLAILSIILFMKQCYLFFQQSAHEIMQQDAKHKDAKEELAAVAEDREPRLLMNGLLEGAEGKVYLTRATLHLLMSFLQLLHNLRLIGEVESTRKVNKD